MAQHILARTASFFQGISENGESAGAEGARWQVPLLVSGLGEADHGGIIPSPDGGGEGDGTEGIAEEVSEQAALMSLLAGILPPEVFSPTRCRHR
jgi:hypothetical protein